MTKPDKSIDETKRLMGALVRMKPKPHEEMKVGKKKKKSKAKKVGVDDQGRADKAIKGATGKRLTYRTPDRATAE